VTIAKPAIFHDFLKLEVDLEFLDQVFKIRAHLSVSVCNGQCCDNSTTGTSSCSGGDHKIKQSLCGGIGTMAVVCVHTKFGSIVIAA
jgi:hypothetical protein